MSKLAHSHQKTMDEIDRQRAIESGNEDLLICPICSSADEPCRTTHKTTAPEHGALTIFWCAKCTAALGKEFRCED